MKRWALVLAAAGLLMVILASGPVTAANIPEQPPALNDKGVAVWLGLANGRYQVYRADPKNGAAQISDSDYENWAPQLNAKGVVAWMGSGVDYYKVFYYDPKHPPAIVISPVGHDARWPELNAKGQVLFYVDNGSFYSAWLYNPKTPPAVQIWP